jgi:hypothetical protein
MGKMEVLCPECNKLFKSTEEMSAHYTRVHENGLKEEEITSENTKELLISDQMTDEEIKSKIAEDMANLRMHEVGTSWMRLGTLLSLNASDQMMGAGFKALIDQNKIIIRQNELLLRALVKNKAKD